MPHHGGQRCTCRPWFYLDGLARSLSLGGVEMLARILDLGSFLHFLSLGEKAQLKWYTSILLSTHTVQCVLIIYFLGVEVLKATDAQKTMSIPCAVYVFSTECLPASSNSPTFFSSAFTIRLTSSCVAGRSRARMLLASQIGVADSDSH